MRRRNGRRFLPLRDVQRCFENQKVNVIGVILDLGLPKPTKGTDFCCPIRIIDETHYQPAVAINLFAHPITRLPHIAAAGDIILLCPVQVRTMPSGEINASFNVTWSYSNFALFKGEGDDNDAVPYQSSSDFHPTDEDKWHVIRLRKWLVNFQLPEDSSDFPMFREIKEGFLNLVCKILHYWKAANNERFIFVWDGTDTPANAIGANLEDEVNYPLPLHPEPEPSPWPREPLCNVHTVGSILRIQLDGAIMGNEFDVLKIGKWVKFVNMYFKVDTGTGLWNVLLTGYSKLRYIPNEDSLIIERERLSDERNLLESGRIPCRIPGSSLCITEVNNEDAQYVTLMDVLTHSEVTAKFKCVVRVVAAKPGRAEELCSPDGTYRMQLTLEDPTARIHAFVVAEDGVTLFDAKPGNCIAKVTRKLNRLLGVTECDKFWFKDTPRNPPWVAVCLKSFSVSQTDVWGSRQFRIFDTKIVEEP